MGMKAVFSAANIEAGHRHVKLFVNTIFNLKTF